MNINGIRKGARDHSLRAMGITEFEKRRPKDTHTGKTVASWLAEYEWLLDPKQEIWP